MEYSTKETETLKKNRIEILELKKSIKDMKNEIMSLNRTDQMEERIGDVKDINLQMRQMEEERFESKRNKQIKEL